MTKRLINTLFLLCLFSIPAQADGPAWWKMSDDDTTIYITGTVHILPPGLDWQRDDLATIIENATLMIQEFDDKQGEPAVILPLTMKYGMLPAGESLTAIIGEERFNALVESTDGQIPALALDRMRPWLAATTASVMELMKAGYDPESGVDKILQGMAQEAGVAIEGFETAEEQILMLAGMEGADAVALFQATSDQNVDVGAEMEKLISIWLSGDMDALAEATMKDMGAYPAVMETLLYERNRNWANQTEKLLERPGTIVIAVGAAHLAGDQSLIDLLQSRGYSVERY